MPQQPTQTRSTHVEIAARFFRQRQVAESLFLELGVEVGQHLLVLLQKNSPSLYSGLEDVEPLQARNDFLDQKMQHVANAPVETDLGINVQIVRGRRSHCWGISGKEVELSVGPSVCDTVEHLVIFGIRTLSICTWV